MKSLKLTAIALMVTGGVAPTLAQPIDAAVRDSLPIVSADELTVVTELRERCAAERAFVLALPRGLTGPTPEWKASHWEGIALDDDLVNDATAEYMASRFEDEARRGGPDQALNRYGACIMRERARQIIHARETRSPVDLTTASLR